MSLFSGIENVQVKTKKEEVPFITKPGSFVAEITSAYAGKSRKSGEPFMLLKFRVVSARDGDYQPGDQLAYWRKLFGDYNMSDVRSFGGAVLGCDPNTVSEVDMNKMFENDGELLVGAQINVRAVANSGGKTDKNGNFYMKVFFSPARDTEDVEAGF